MSADPRGPAARPDIVDVAAANPAVGRSVDGTALLNDIVADPAPGSATQRALGIEDLRSPVYEPYWLWCRRHQQSVPPGFKCRRKDRTGYYSTDECVRIGPFMSEREANRLTGNQPAGYGAWALGMEVE